MRAPFQILAIPYRMTDTPAFAVLHRADHDQWQFVSGGGEEDETPAEAAVREICEEFGVKAEKLEQLTSMTYIPAGIFARRHRENWPKGTYVVPEYAFAFVCDADPVLSEEHTEFRWLDYGDAMTLLKWDSNKTALYELNCRLLEDRRMGNPI